VCGEGFEHDFLASGNSFQFCAHAPLVPPACPKARRGKGRARRARGRVSSFQSAPFVALSAVRSFSGVTGKSNCYMRNRYASKSSNHDSGPWTMASSPAGRYRAAAARFVLSRADGRTRCGLPRSARVFAHTQRSRVAETTTTTSGACRAKYGCADQRRAHCDSRTRRPHDLGPRSVRRLSSPCGKRRATDEGAAEDFGSTPSGIDGRSSAISRRADPQTNSAADFHGQKGVSRYDDRVTTYVAQRWPVTNHTWLSSRPSKTCVFPEDFEGRKETFAARPAQQKSSPGLKRENAITCPGECSRERAIRLCSKVVQSHVKQRCFVCL
jgi:hypothetical protein